MIYALKFILMTAIMSAILQAIGYLYDTIEALGVGLGLTVVIALICLVERNELRYK